MFALPGIIPLVVFILARPLDLFPALRGLPLLYVFSGLAVAGLVMDIRLGFTKVRIAQHFVWAMAFIAWCVVTLVFKAQYALVPAVVFLTTLVVVYVAIAQGIQTFKAFEALGVALLACSLFIAGTCIYLGMQPKQCVEYWPGETRLADLGHPDGRHCQSTVQCVKGGDTSNAYSCEHAGAFGMTSVEGRVRYVGTLQDPNEVALFCSAVLPFAFGFYQRRRTRLRAAVAVSVLVITVVTVKMTMSRGGMLVLGTVLVVYAVQRYGLKRVLKIGLPLAALLWLYTAFGDSGGGRADAEASTLKRLGCMHKGFQMFGTWPFLGAGFGQFTQHHDQTAHNSYLLALAELGVPGLLLWTSAYYVAVKTMIVARRRCVGEEAAVARIWGTAVSTSLIGMSLGVFFLSFTYHFVIWIFFGLASAFSAAVKRHDAQWRVPIGWRDFVLIIGGNVVALAALYLYIVANVGG